MWIWDKFVKRLWSKGERCGYVQERKQAHQFYTESNSTCVNNLFTHNSQWTSSNSESIRWSLLNQIQSTNHLQVATIANPAPIFPREKKVHNKFMDGQLYKIITKHGMVADSIN